MYFIVCTLLYVLYFILHLDNRVFETKSFQAMWVRKYLNIQLKYFCRLS